MQKWVKRVEKWSKVVYNGSTMFMGTYYNSIDDKNRMIVPAKHRDMLGNSCVLTKGLDKCLYIYTKKAWETQIEKISALPQSRSEVRKFIRHMAAGAIECTFDKQGRISIPQNLKEYATISKELVTVGAITKIEVWAKETWENPSEAIALDTSEFEEALKEFDF